MACETPIVIKVPEGYYNPISGQTENQATVPCGKCLPCKKKRVNQWSVRLMNEQKSSYSSYFVTLTYNNDYVPLTKRGRMTLVKTTEQYEKLPKQHRYENKDVSCQAFIKRLRYYEEEAAKKGKVSLEQYIRARKTTAPIFPGLTIKYYAVGEYGSKKFRPHLHIILFNVVDTNSIKLAWTFGEVWIDEVNQNTVEYTLKYICKPPEAKQKGFDGINEFSLMSKGLGKNYITEDAKRFHKKEYNNFVVNGKGIKIPTPRYYSEKMVDKSDRERKAVYQYNESIKRENEQQRLVHKDSKLSLSQQAVSVAMANKHKLKTPIKQRGND